MSELDALQCFATVSVKRRYVRPEFSSDEVEVIDGRHPVVEKVMDHQEYVPNDCQMIAHRCNFELDAFRMPVCTLFNENERKQVLEMGKLSDTNHS